MEGGVNYILQEGEMVDDNIRYSPLILSADDQATFDKENAQDEAQQELLKKMKHASSATTLAPSVTAPTWVVAALPTVGIDMAPAIKTIQQKLDESSTKLRLAREQALAVKAENDRKQAAAVEELCTAPGREKGACVVGEGRGRGRGHSSSLLSGWYE